MREIESSERDRKIKSEREIYEKEGDTARVQIKRERKREREIDR